MNTDSLSCDTVGPCFLYAEITKGGAAVYHENGKELIERLIKCGFTESNATDICMKYAADNRWKDLEDYIRANELLYNDWKQYPSER